MWVLVTGLITGILVIGGDMTIYAMSIKALGAEK